MYRVRGTAKCLLKSLVTSCQVKVIRGHEVRKGKIHFLGLSGAMRVLCLIFVKNVKNDHETLFERPNSEEKIKIISMPKSPGIA